MQPFLLCLSLGLLPSSAVPSTEEWITRVQEIAKTYESYGRVDRQYRWSPLDCRMPQPMPPMLHLSASDDQATHGQKLYTIFARKTYWDANRKETGFARRPTYLPPFVKGQEGRARQASEVGQVIVKEAWVPIKMTDQERQAFTTAQEAGKDKQLKVSKQESTHGKDLPNHIYDHGDQLIPYALQNGQQYKRGDRAGLFIMFKVESTTPGTDQGWVYATVEKDMKTVTAVGVIASCAKCHAEAKHDRLIGWRE